MRMRKLIVLSCKMMSLIWNPNNYIHLLTLFLLLRTMPKILILSLFLLLITMPKMFILKLSPLCPVNNLKYKFVKNSVSLKSLTGIRILLILTINNQITKIDRWKKRKNPNLKSENPGQDLNLRKSMTSYKLRAINKLKQAKH
jgi:hypothetical protein